MNTKAGFVALIGKPNSGKSTLMNAIMGEKLSIVTNKPQTTRKRVKGIYSADDFQAVFVDTPGIVKPKYQMHRSMMNYVEEAVVETDIITVIIDSDAMKKGYDVPNEYIINLLKKNKAPKILLLNKIDLDADIKKMLPLVDEMNKLGIFDEIIPISALKNSNIDTYLNVLKKYMPESPFYYDPEMLSTQPERFFVSEIIREHVFKGYSKEIPYSTEVNIIEFKEREEGKWFIHAEIIVERKSQKIIIIGKKGAKIKDIGQRARADIEEHLQMPVFLELFVKVRDKWRDNPTMLKHYGY